MSVSRFAYAALALPLLVGITLGASAPASVTLANASTPIADATSATTTASTSASPSGAAIQTGAVSGQEKVYVSVVSTTPQTSDDVNTGMTQSAVQTMIGKLNSYWSAQSNGAVTVQLAGYETRTLNESTCSPNAALTAEEGAAFGGMFAGGAWRGTHKHLLVLSTESCSAESFATVGGTGGEIFSGNGISASEGVEYLLHEFGHNLGFEHADASICTNTTSYDGLAADFSFTSTVCPTREYDDYFDIMGYTVKNATPNLSTPQRIMAGWLTNYVTLTGSQPSSTVTLTSLDGSGGKQALEIVDPISGDVYYVEYRTDAGLDATSAEFNYGLQCDPKMSGYTICELDSSKTTGAVRVLRFIPFASQNANGTTVLATGLTAGSTDKTKRHTHLNPGNSFTAVDGGFSFTVKSMSPTAGAVIAVSFGHASAGSSVDTTPAKGSRLGSGALATSGAPSTNRAPTVSQRTTPSTLTAVPTASSPSTRDTATSHRSTTETAGVTTSNAASAPRGNLLLRAV